MWDEIKAHTPAEYRHRKTFVVVEFPGSKQLAYRGDVEAGGDRSRVSVVDASTVTVLVPVEQLFDSIRESHLACGHAKKRTTWMKCKEKSVFTVLTS
jgi:hypothetical protein